MKKKKTPQADLETILPLLISQWRRFQGISGPKEVLQTREFRGVVSAVQELQKHFNDSQRKGDDDYFSSPRHLGAYFLYHFVIHYLEGLSLINELPEPPERVLDVCSGPAPYAFAALRHGAKEVVATDRNLEALSLGAELCGRYGNTLSIRRWECTKEQCPVEGKFDLIILSHALDELFPKIVKGWKERQKAFLDSLFAKLTPDGHLLLVESSFKEQNERILSIRDELVNEGISVQAPCVWKGSCPALQGKRSPCYAQREFEKPYLIREIQRAAKIFLSSLKMSYCIFKHPEANWPALPEGECHRVVSPPIEGSTGEHFYLCGTKGKRRLTTSLKTLPKSIKALEYLKRGELIAVEGAELEGLQIRLTEESSLKVVAACGKPLPK